MGKQTKATGNVIPDFRLMYQLAERYSEASELLEQHARRDAYGASGPQTMVDSFAVELYLKCLHVLDNNDSPPRRGVDAHDWVKLFNGLKPHTKTMIRDFFDQSVRDDPGLRNLKEINPEAPAGLTDFGESLRVAARTFSDRRYLYEPRNSGNWFYAHLIRSAIRRVTKLDLRLSAAT